MIYYINTIVKWEMWLLNKRILHKLTHCQLTTTDYIREDLDKHLSCFTCGGFSNNNGSPILLWVGSNIVLYRLKATYDIIYVFYISLTLRINPSWKKDTLNGHNETAHTTSVAVLCNCRGLQYPQHSETVS